MVKGTLDAIWERVKKVKLLVQQSDFVKNVDANLSD
jgi:hypothetical protein